MMQVVVFEGAVSQHVALILVLRLKRDLVAMEQAVLVGRVRTHAHKVIAGPGGVLVPRVPFMLAVERVVVILDLCAVGCVR